MSPYQLNKTISIGIPLLFLLCCLSIFDFNNPSLWWLLIIVAHTLGYTHFILGYLYQYRSLKRVSDKKSLQIFYVLTLVAILFSLIFIFTNLFPLLAVIAIGYFIFHGVLNEVTQMKEFMDISPRVSDLIPLLFYLLTFFLFSLMHPSFFFTPELVFLNPTPDMAVTMMNQIISTKFIHILAIVCAVLFFITMPGKLFFQGRFLASLVIATVAISTFGILFYMQPLSYVFLYFLALSYHFISWGVFILQKFLQRAPERIPQYVLAHVYILVPLSALLVLLIGNVPTVNSLQIFIFNGVIFVVMAMIHNTTSLLNEDWFKKIIKQYV